MGEDERGHGAGMAAPNIISREFRGLRVSRDDAEGSETCRELKKLRRLFGAAKNRNMRHKNPEEECEEDKASLKKSAPLQLSRLQDGYLIGLVAA